MTALSLMVCLPDHVLSFVDSLAPGAMMIVVMTVTVPLYAWMIVTMLLGATLAVRRMLLIAQIHVVI